jgi:hypothetical protein
LFVTVKEKDCNKCPEGIQYFWDYFLVSIY